MNTQPQIDPKLLPRHVAIIMDGNGRWANAHGRDRSFGHRQGVRAVRATVEAAARMGVSFLSFYTFSNENWRRPKHEVQALMQLLNVAIRQEVPDLMRNNVRLLAIGNLERLPAGAQRTLRQAIRETSGNTGLTLILALSYSARWEITQAAKQLAQRVVEGSLRAEGIDEATFAAHLTTADIPDPDLLIRTGGEKRISNFLLWQLSYAELFFTDLCWPDFGEEALGEAIVQFQQRQRRFGQTPQQLPNLSGGRNP